jgi:hypothetical protein
MQFVQNYFGINFFLSEKTFLLSEFFPAKIFFCSERFPFSKVPEKILAGKKFTEQNNFFAEQKRLVQLFFTFFSHFGTNIYQIWIKKCNLATNLSWTDFLKVPSQFFFKFPNFFQSMRGPLSIS